MKHGNSRDLVVPSKYKAYFFDLDGTLLDSAPELVRAAQYAARQFNASVLPESVLRSSVSNGARALLRRMLPEDKIEEAHPVMLAHYVESGMHKSRLFDALETLLLTLQQKPVVWGIMTNKPRYLSEPLLQSILPWWNQSTLYCADDFERSKPHPDPLLHIAETLSIAPTSACYIGDHIKDIHSANAANWHPIGARWGYHDDEPQLWQCRHLFDTPTQLCNWIYGQLH